MMGLFGTIKIKHLLTEDEDFETVQKNMNNIADVLEKHSEFTGLIDDMRAIPKGDDVFKPVDYANKLLDKMYDIADRRLIRIN